MSKKAQGMSLNIIVIAALALLVLVVLTAIFVGKMSQTSKKSDENEQMAYSNICMAPKDGYSQIKCMDTCEDPWQLINPPGGTSTGSSGWMDCNKRCCGLRTQ